LEFQELLIEYYNQYRSYYITLVQKLSADGYRMRAILYMGTWCIRTRSRIFL